MARSANPSVRPASGSVLCSLLGKGLPGAKASRPILATLATGLLLALLQSCGGGGGGSPVAPPQAGVTVTLNPASTAVTASHSRTFSATVTGATNYQVTWSLVEGASAGTISSAGFYTAPATTGTYHVRATSIADATQAATAEVSVVAAPNATITAASALTVGTSGLTASVPDQPGCQYAWTLTGGGTITTGAASRQITYSAPLAAGTQTLQCAVTNAAQDTDTKTFAQVAGAPPTAVLSTPTQAGWGNAGLIATINATAGAHYAWTVTNGLITAGQDTPQITFTAGNQGTTLVVSCLVTDAAGLQATASQTIALTPGIAVSLTAAGTVTAGRTDLAASVTPTGGTGYVWTLQGGTLKTGQGTPSITYTAGAVGSLVLGCQVTTASGMGLAQKSVQVVAPPSISSFNAAKTTLTAGKATTLTALFAGGTGSIDQGLGPVNSGVALSTGNLTANTTFTLTVTNAAGDTATHQALVTVVAAPAISSFTAAKTSVPSGSATTLTPVFTGGTGTIDQGLGPVASGASVATANLTANTTYTLTVTNAAGDAATQTCTVNVLGVPVITSFTSAKPAVTAGVATTLTAVFSGGTASVDQGVGTISSGIAATTPVLTKTTTYTLTVTNALGVSSSATVTVEVAESPVITSFTAAKTPITSGNATTLTAVFTGGAGVVDHGIGTALSGTELSIGNITATTTYTLTVTNALGEKATSSVTVQVFSAPLITSFVATKPLITSGTATTLTAVFSNGAGVVDGGLGTMTSGTPKATSALGATTTYTLTVTNPAGDKTTATVTVNVVDAPAIARFAPAKPVVTTGAGTVLQATFTGGTGALNQSLGPITSGVDVPTGNLTTSTTYTLVVTNSAGDTATGTATVQVVPPPVVTSFTMAKSPITSGNATTLTATFTGGAGAVDKGIGAVTSGTAITTGTLTADTTYTLTITSPSGDKITSTVTVKVVPAPSISTFQATPAVITVGETTTLSYTFTGGTGTIDQGLGTVTSGGTSVVKPLKTTDYTLTVTNEIGEISTFTLHMVVAEVPLIDSFAPSPVAISPEGYSFLSASFRNGTGSIDHGVGAIASAARTKVAPAATTTYTVTVTNAAGRSVTATTTVTVNPLLTLLIPDPTSPGVTVNLDMVLIPAGAFVMGSPTSEPGHSSYEEPLHLVTFAQPFYMARTETTQALWKAIMWGNPSHFTVAGGGSATDDLTRPVEQVSWADVRATTTGFIDKLNAATVGTRPTGMAFRLPSEAEWEYSCRAGSQTRYFWGDDISNIQINYFAWSSINSSSTTHPVATKQPNSFGIFDMSGNVWEWVEDYYHENYSGAPSDGSAWLTGTPNDACRRERGGSYVENYYSSRSAQNVQAIYTDKGPSSGFRVVLANVK